MAKILSNAGIITGLPVEAEHVSQSVNALTGAEAYDIRISGSLTVNNLKYPLVDGAAGQSLVTDGVGNITIQPLDTVDTASYVTSSNVYGPFGADSIQTASYAPSSSLADFAKLASSSFFALQTLNAQTATSASYALTASYLIGERSASYVSSSISGNTITFTKSDGLQVTNEITSASYALTASYAISASHNITQRVTSSYSETASYALTASHALNVDPNTYISSSTAGNAIIFSKPGGLTDVVFVNTASYAVYASSSVSSSYAVTASYVQGPIATASYAERAEQTKQISFPAYNDDNVTILAGTPLHVVEVTPQNVYKVRKADASDHDRMPAAGVALSSSAPGESTELVVVGEIKNLNTFGTTVGKNIYVQTGSGITETQPQGSAIIQPIGIVTAEDFIDGKILINGPMAGMPFGNALSSSYALTASYALNGGGGGGGTYTSTYVTSDITAEKDRIYVFEESTPFTLTLPLSPTNGDSILISNRSGITTNLIGRNGELIMGIAEDMELNVPPASFMFTYASGLQGWVITGAGSGGGGAITGSAGSFNTGSFAVTSSNQFKGDQFFTGSLIPEAINGNGIYDVGSLTHPWRDLYVSTSSLKFVRDAIVIADLNGEDGGVRIGNIFIGTGSISIVSGSGDDMTVIGEVVNTEISGGIITPIAGDAILPTGSISSSAQISSLGFITSSQTIDTGSFITTSSLDEYLPTGSISSSAQIEGLGFVTSSSLDGYLPTGSISSSAQIEGLGFVTSTSLDEYLPTGSISSSAQLTSLGFVSASANGSTEFSGSTSFVGDTSFTGSLTVIDPQGFSVVGNTFLQGFNNFSGSTAIFGENLQISTPITASNTSLFTAPVNINSNLNVIGGITGSLQGTASVSLDSVLFDGKDTATFATTGSNDFKSSQYISGSVVIAPSNDPGTSNLNATYLFTSASNFSEDECDFYYRNKGTLWDQEWLEYGVGSGLIYGGIVTFSGTDLFVSPGGGLVVNYNAKTGSANAVVPTQVKWGPITSSATFLTSSQFSHLYIDEYGDLKQQVEDFTTSQYLEKIPLGTLGHLTNTYIDAFGEEKQTTYAGPAQSNQFIRSFGPLKQQGYDISPSGSNLNFNTANGITFKLGGFYSKDPNNPSVYDTPPLTSSGKTVRVHQSGSEFIGDINSGNFYNNIDPTKYDSGTGTLVNISGSTTTIQRLFVGPTSERFYVYYGQETYDSIATAVSKLSTEQFVESLTTSKSLTFLGYFVVRADATDLSDVNQANIINSGLFRNTVGGSGGGTSTISNLGEITDVTITSPTTGQYLEYNAGIFRNKTIQYDEIDSNGVGIISSSIQLQSLGVNISTGSSTEFDNSVGITGNLAISGDTHFNGSVYGKVVTVTAQFAGITYFICDASDANFFQFTIQGSQTNQIFVNNGSPGQTINLKIKQASSSLGTITWNSNIKFPDGFDSSISTGGSDEDVFTFITWDGTNWYATGLKNFS
tara:strand:- start:1784 stop:6178 length:4395 start_codon:yes stop_codon:yes gene_type:complete